MRIQKWIKMGTQNQSKWRTKIDQNGDPKIPTQNWETQQKSIKMEMIEKSTKMGIQNAPQKSGFWGPKMGPLGLRFWNILCFFDIFLNGTVSKFCTVFFWGFKHLSCFIIILLSILSVGGTH